MFNKKRELIERNKHLQSVINDCENELRNARIENIFLRRQNKINKSILEGKEKEKYCNHDVEITKMLVNLIHAQPFDDIRTMYPYQFLKHNNLIDTEFGKMSEGYIIRDGTRYVSENILENKKVELAKISDQLEREKNDVAILENQLNQTKREYNRYKEQRETGEDFQLGKNLVKANKQIELYKEQMILKDNALEKKNKLINDLKKSVKSYYEISGILL